MTTTEGSNFSLDLGGDGGEGIDLDDLLNDEERQELERNEQQRADGQQPSRQGDPDQRASAIFAKQVAEQEKRIAEQQRQIDELTRTQRFGTTDQQQVSSQPVSSPSQVSEEQLREQLGQQFVKDPGGTLLNLYKAARSEALQEIQKQTGTIATGTVGLEIANFRREAATQTDPYAQAALDEFDRMTADPATIGALSQQTPQQRAQALSFMFSAAKGNSIGKVADASRRQRTPPGYSGGRSFSTSPGSAVEDLTATSYRGKPLNEEQKIVLDMAKEHGIRDPKRIRAMLDEAGG